MPLTAFSYSFSDPIFMESNDCLPGFKVFFFFDILAYFIVVVYFLGSCELKGEKKNAKSLTSCSRSKGI